MLIQCLQLDTQAGGKTGNNKKSRQQNTENFKTQSITVLYQEPPSPPKSKQKGQ